MSHVRILLSVLLLATASACDSGTHDPGGHPIGGGGPPSDTCGSVRMTAYTVASRGWCEFDRSYSFLPTFVRNGLTAAIAEPFDGSSYGGDPGEACGECWEVDTLHDTRIVMITDLCPIVGNPLCAGPQFHLDLATEAASVLQAGGLDEGSARRVPCPVTGNVHVLVNDDNVSYLRLAFMNHRIPLRAAEWRAAGPGVTGDNPWTPVTRSGGAWEATGGGNPLARGGTGVVFRLTSAQGQVVESNVIVPTHPAHGSTFDLGIQFDDLVPQTGGSCVFEPPAIVYTDGWGGIDQVTWMINPWGPAESGFYGVVSSNCYGGTGSCLQVSNLAQWSGFHLYYRQAFPTGTFARVTLRARTVSGTGQINVTPGNETTPCASTTVDVTTTYTDVSIDLATACAGVAEISQVTIANPGNDIGIVLDDVVFQK